MARRRTPSSPGASASVDTTATAVDLDLTELNRDLDDAFDLCWLSRGWKLRGGATVQLLHSVYP